MNRSCAERAHICLIQFKLLWTKMVSISLSQIEQLFYWKWFKSVLGLHWAGQAVLYLQLQFSVYYIWMVFFFCFGVSIGFPRSRICTYARGHRVWATMEKCRSIKPNRLQLQWNLNLYFVYNFGLFGHRDQELEYRHKQKHTSIAPIPPLLSVPVNPMHNCIQLFKSEIGNFCKYKLNGIHFPLVVVGAVYFCWSRWCGNKRNTMK